MNYDQPRKRLDGKFDMTSTNDRVVHPIGYCHAYRPPAPDDWLYQTSKAYWDRLVDFKDKFHVDGHASEVEASDCYREYLLDQTLMFIEMKPYEECAVCKTVTKTWAQIDGWPKFCLCPEHANRAEIEKLWSKGEIYSSIHS